jgi:nitroimidazol reductase NimA-like FMN-containing flavoprotein (pyridoxamine 5'-phosphate oxidase superfamily)
MLKGSINPARRRSAAGLSAVAVWHPAPDKWHILDNDLPGRGFCGSLSTCQIKGTDMSQDLRKTDKTTITRHAERGSYDRELANAILDEGMVAHVAFDVGNGVTVLPMTYARLGDEIVLHGAVASRWLSSFGAGHPVSVCVTLLDGLVLAQSAFSHSMNYRSLVAFGNATVVTDPVKKQAALRAFVDHLLPGRWDDCKQPDRKESDATVVLAVPIHEASIKVRSGPPKDAAKDLGEGHWTGVIPLTIEAGEPVPDPVMESGVPLPDYVKRWKRG